MKRAFIILLLPLFSSAQTCTISGNAYWHYNDYVGNKPDAGTVVYLFTGDSTKGPDDTQCDVMGNFKFDNLKAGDYLVLVVSENTTDDGSYNFIPFDAYKEGYRKFLGFDIRDYKAAYDSIDLLEKAFENAVTQKITIWNGGKRMKDSETRKNALALQKRRLLSMCAEHACIFYSLALMPLRSLTVQRKMTFSIVSLVPGQNKTVISDFGITYR